MQLKIGTNGLCKQEHDVLRRKMSFARIEEPKSDNWELFVPKRCNFF